ncbi:MAG: cysteine--tRNA ligase [Bacteroidales bacterium]|nr:cysteine--tRNA ligase [Lentimicrobiaceae bacterium]MDD5694376.1 cysteine--tRNA ligase [Bacteroidales bacterium]
MEQNLLLYNTLSRRKESFIPQNPPHVGMYVCGPTVYGHAHLGHSRPAITFDMVCRYLRHLGYKVRYVRNITDVGHLEHDLDEGEDKIAKKARLEQLEPMEVAQYYMNSYHHNMEQLNTLPPSIEPIASGHIIDQIATIERILKNGFAYVVNGSVYFDIQAYSRKHDYGKLSGRRIDDLVTDTRELEGQDEKRFPADFALWKKASPEHIMRWPSPWSDGFPGWHLECSVMGAKYLGIPYDIHGGGMDLIFPHHESEIAQSVAAYGQEHVRIWLHNNMVTLNGQKMGKSLGNAISLDDVFTGNHPLLDQPYSPMTIRFFVLQAHYRSTLDFSNEALQAAAKGLKRLFAGMDTLERLPSSDHSTLKIKEWEDKCYEAMNDDLNSPVLIAQLFEALHMINLIHTGAETLSVEDLADLKKNFHAFTFDVLGLKREEQDQQSGPVSGLMDALLRLRASAREKKDWKTADMIRNELARLKIRVKDTKDGAEWEMISD